MPYNGRCYSVSCVRAGARDAKHQSVTHAVTGDSLLTTIMQEVRDYCLILLDPEGRITSWNQGAEITFGISADQAVGRPVDIIFTAADRAAGVARNELDTALRQGRAEDTRWLAGRSGGHIYFEGSITALRDSDGTHAGYLKIGRDITAEYGAIEALKSEEERYRLLVESAADYAIYMLDASARVSSWNSGAERIKQYSAEEVIGRPYETFFTEQDVRDGVPTSLLARADQEGRVQQEGIRVRKDGSQYMADAVITALRHDDGTTRGYSVVTRDVTERKAAERERLELERTSRQNLEQVNEQLRRRAREEREFRQLASALTGALDVNDVLLEITSRVTDVARADGVYVEQITSANGTVTIVATAGRGTPQRGITVPYPGSLTEEILEGRNPVILASMQQFGREMAPYLTESCGDCQILVVPLTADREPLGALVLLNSGDSGRSFSESDIERARTLGDLASLALRRVRMIEQETSAREAAEKAVHARDEILGVVTHDLRNPLTRILLTLQLLRAEELPDSARAHIGDVEQASKQMQRLIEDLLDSARIESGRLSVRMQLVPAREIAEQAAREHREMAAARGQRLKVEIEDDLPEICVDRGRMLQVFGNLLGNAVKFTPEGGEIEFTARREMQHVVFTISDSGPGIPPSDLPHVFERYWQAKKTAHLGAGLGLTIVKGIVDAHRGNVTVTNGPLGGAEFVVQLPLEPPS